MRDPGQDGREHDVDRRFGGDGTEEQPQAGDVLIGRDQRRQMRQRQQHKPKADCYPADVAGAGDGAAAKGEDADQHQE